MKLNNKGFALTSIIYMLIVLFLMIMLLILANLAQRKVVLDKIKNDVKQKLNQGGVASEKITARDLYYQSNYTQCRNIQCAIDELYGRLNGNGNQTSNQPVSFATDSWATIKNAIHNNNTSAYHVGDRKQITLIGTGDLARTLYVRVANNSNYDCSLDSKTACGFVVEFEDIITTHIMNSTDTNVGGWPATEMRSWLNSTVLAALPTDLQSVIATTTVVSGHGSTSGESNFTSQDKLYLLSSREIYGTSFEFDTLTTQTRQLDYYYNGGNGLTSGNSGSSHLDMAIKRYNGTANTWWLRSTDGSWTAGFIFVSATGYWDNYSGNVNYGVSPAFRID